MFSKVKSYLKCAAVQSTYKRYSVELDCTSGQSGIRPGELYRLSWANMPFTLL
nr:MAG TPA: hypothetical protein [Caudoviricetes sp.]